MAHKIRKIRPGMNALFLGTKDRRPNVRTKNHAESSKGSLFQFDYTSMGATNPSPLILNLRRKGKGGTRKFKFSGAKTRTEDYIVGVVLDGVSPTVQAYLIRKFQNRTYLTYSEMKIMGRFIKFMYRVYNWRHIRNFKVVNAEEYVNMVLGRFK